MVPWSEELDLADFYKKAEAKGYVNNSSQKKMVDCFNNERVKQVWILYKDNTPVGSVAAHSLDFLGPNAYRICARTCVFTDELERTALRTISVITHHQNYTSQYYIPTCIDWAPPGADLYITSTEKSEGSQLKVNRTFCPALEKTGVLSFAGRRVYRDTEQNFWKLNVENFYRDLDHYGRWEPLGS